MVCHCPPFGLHLLAEATQIAPRRRGSPVWAGSQQSSDGCVGDAAHQAGGGDHNCYGSSMYCHATDISQSMPGAPFWEDKFDQFDAHAYGDQIALRIAAGVERRVKYLVSHNYQTGNAKVWSLEKPFWHDQDGDDHASHLHVSFTVAAEQSVAPFFGYATPTEEDMPLNAADIETIRQIVKQTVENAIGGASMTPPDPHATVVDVVKHYSK